MPAFTRDITENLTISTSVSALRTGPILGTVPKQVKALVLNGSDNRQGVSMTWQPLEQNAAYYHVYVIGAVAYANPITGPTLGIVDGDTLEITTRGGKKQTIIFGAPYINSGFVTLSQVVDNINAQLQGATAALTYLTNNIFIRPNDKSGKGAKIQVHGGTANAFLQFPTNEFSINTNISTAQLLATLDHPENNYEDKNGVVEDFYYVQAESSTGLIGQKSLIKTLSIYNDEIPTRSVIWGIIVDPSGKPVKNLEITLRPPQAQVPSINNRTLVTSNFGISSKPVKVLTDDDGYFEIEAVVESILNLYIPDIKYDFVIRVPSATTEFTLLPIAQENLNYNLTDSFFFPSLAGGGQSAHLGEILVVNEDDRAIPIRTVEGGCLQICGTVDIGDIEVDFTGVATELTLAALLAKFDGTQDIGDVTVLNFPATQAISAVSLPLPSGASTSALQTTGNTSLASIDSKLTNPLPVSGPLTDAQLRATPVPVTGSLTADITGDTADLDSGVGLDPHEVFAIGLPGAGGHVIGGTASNPIRIDPTGSTTQPVSLASVPLPTGAATESTLAAILANTEALDVDLSTRASEITLGLVKTNTDTLDVDLSTRASESTLLSLGSFLASTLDVDLSTRASEITVAGLLTDTQLRASPVPVIGPLTDTELRASAVPVSVASLPLPAGASTLAEQQTQTGLLTTLTGVDYATLTEQEAQTGFLEIMSEWDSSDRAKVSPIPGQNGVAAGVGTTDALTQRVVLPTDQSAIPTNRAVASAETLSNVTASTVTTLLLGSNANRKGAIFYNDATGALYLKFGVTASSTSFTYKLNPGDHLEMPEPIYTGIIDGIWTALGGAVRITETT